jgi:dihydroorotase
MKLYLKIFSSTPLIAVHCEDEATIKNHLAKYTAEYGEIFL